MNQLEGEVAVNIGDIVHTNFNEDPHAVSFSNFNEPKPSGPSTSFFCLCLTPSSVSEQLRRDVEAIERDGYVVIENLLSPKELQDIRDALEPHLRQKGRNNFEGTATQRVYALLAKSRAFDALAVHPRVLQLLDNFLLPNYLLTAYQAIKYAPGSERWTRGKREEGRGRGKREKGKGKKEKGGRKEGFKTWGMEEGAIFQDPPGRNAPGFFAR
jgi:hypothetical protein